MWHWHQLKTILLTCVIAILCAISFGSLPAMAQMAPEYYTGSWPDQGGNYPLKEAYQAQWRVVDPDPTGLNCRASLPSPAGLAEVVATFTQGDILQAIPRERGVTEIMSVRGETWLRVALETGDTCWVRANSQFIEPVN